MKRQARIETFREFWAYYVGEHRHPRNRILHYIGTSAGLSCLVLAPLLGMWWLLALAPILGYGHAWVGHFAVEGNKPASFAYPGWSFLGDLKMLALALTGRMDEEVERLYGSAHPADDAPCLIEFKKIAR